MKAQSLRYIERIKEVKSQSLNYIEQNLNHFLLKVIDAFKSNHVIVNFNGLLV